MAYKNVKIPLSIKGLDKRSQPTTLEGTSPDMQNVKVDRGVIKKRRGYSQMGTDIMSDGTASEKGQQLIEWTDSRGTVHNIGLTTEKAYLYDTINDEWDDISPTAGDFTGAASNRWSFTTAHDATNFSNNGGSALVISNDVDLLQYYEGQNGAKFNELDTSDIASTFNHAKEVLEYWNHLFTLNYNDGGTPVDNVKSFLYASLAAVTTWASGTSGDGTLTDSVGKIVRALKIKNESVIYSENSITRCVYVGGDTLYAFPTVIYDVGLYAHNAIASANDLHYLIGSDKRIYEYQASHVYSIGDLIEDDFFDDLDTSKNNAIVMGVDKSNHRIYVFYPTTSDTYAKSYYCIDYRTKAWEYGRLQDNVRAISQHNGNMIFLTSAGTAYKFDGSTYKDNATNINAYYHTPDITVDKEENYFRISLFSFSAKSAVSNATIEIDYSTDSGSSWTEMESAYSLSTSWTHYRVPVDVSARKCRFRISQNSDKDFQIRSMYCNIEAQEVR